MSVSHLLSSPITIPLNIYQNTPHVAAPAGRDPKCALTKNPTLDMVVSHLPLSTITLKYLANTLRVASKSSPPAGREFKLALTCKYVHMFI